MDYLTHQKDLLFSTPVLRVLDFLLQHPEQELIDVEITRRIHGVKKSAVNMALRKLADAGLVHRHHRGRMALNSLADTALVTTLKSVSNIMTIDPLVRSLYSLCDKIVLFGSRAEGNNDSGSDYDLFIVTVKKHKVDELILRSEFIDMIHVIIKSPEQMLTVSEDEPVLYDQIKRGIVLWERE